MNFSVFKTKPNTPRIFVLYFRSPFSISIQQLTGHLAIFITQNLTLKLAIRIDSQ